MNLWFSACAEHCKKCKVKGPKKCDIGECDVNYGNNPKNEDCDSECGGVVVFIWLYHEYRCISTVHICKDLT